MNIIKPQRKIPHSDKDILKEGCAVLCKDHIYTMKIISINNGNAFCEWLDNNGKTWSKEFNLFDLKIII